MSCNAGSLTSEMMAGYAQIAAGYLPDSAGVVRYTENPDGAGGTVESLQESPSTPGFAFVVACGVAPANGQQESQQGDGQKSRADFDLTFPAGTDIQATDKIVVVSGIAPSEWTPELAAAGVTFGVTGTDKGKSRAMNLITRCRKVI